MAESAAGTRVRGGTIGPLTVIGWIVAPTSWLALVHVFAGPLIGLTVAMLLVIGVTLGVALLPFFGFGVLVLAGVLWLCTQFARFERARFGLLLGLAIPAPPRPAPQRGWRRIWRLVTRPAVWKSFGYTLVRLPLGVAEAAPALAVWATALALVTMPAYNSHLPGGAARIGTFRMAGPWWPALACAAGAVLLVAAPALTRLLAAADGYAGRFLLGSSGTEELAARIGELETSRARVIDAAEAERMRIERDLHDGAQQRLVALAMDLGRAKAKFGTDPEGAALIVSQAHEQAKEALAELRNLVRGVHPPVLTDRGLDAALSGLAALCPVPVSVSVDLPVRPPAAIEAIAYFVVAEALTNVAKHSHAGRADVTVIRRGLGPLTIKIFDNGTGGADPGGQGLSGLAARVAGVDGRLVVTSPPGGPTTVEVLLPCGS